MERGWGGNPRLQRIGPHKKTHKVYKKICYPISGIQTRMQKAVLSLKKKEDEEEEAGVSVGT